MKMSDILSWFKLPLWAYGIECAICRMTFISPNAHYLHAKKSNLVPKHLNKIPTLK